MLSNLLIGGYIVLFSLGFTTGFSKSFYNDFRILEFSLLLILLFLSSFNKKYIYSNYEILFFTILVLGYFYWENYFFILSDLLVFYLLYKNFLIVKYNESVTRFVVILGFLNFLLLPFSLLDYYNNGLYEPNWYLLPWNIRVYDSYFLILSIYSFWLYTKGRKDKYAYLFIIYLSFLAILLDAGRSSALSFSIFILIIAIKCKVYRLKLLSVYASVWLTYLFTIYFFEFSRNEYIGIAVVRESSSGRLDLWKNALGCWLQHPIIGCGFYQLNQYSQLSAHPHNLFIQVLTETGMIGFSFLLIIIYKVAKNISWSLKKNCFVISAMIAITIDMLLSGNYIYPVTQIALLWLFIFLLKNPDFDHAQYFNKEQAMATRIQRLSMIVIFILIGGWFLYLSINASNFSDDLPVTPPRFWEYGYKLY